MRPVPTLAPPHGLFRKRYWDDKEVVSLVAGSLAGALTATFVCPLDVLKTRLQVQQAGAVHRSIPASLGHIFAEEGVRGLYRGLGPTIFALLPNWAVYFTVYEQLKTAMGEKTAGRRVHLVHIAAATGAGMVTMLATNPLWVVKTRLQTQNLGIRMGRAAAAGAPPYKGTFNSLRRIGREEGLAGLYSGLLPSLMGVAHVAIQFPLYEWAKARVARRLECDPSNLPATDLVTISAASKMVASTATYPHEVIRSHMHVEGTGPFRGFLRTCRRLYAEEGVAAFYKGCMTNLLRTTPAAALTFTSFELLSRELKRLGARQRQRERARRGAAPEGDP